MIVPAGRRYVTDPSVLVEGHIYFVDSNLGGSYGVRYEGVGRDGRHRFVRPADADHPRQVYRVEDEGLATQVYITPPADRWWVERWDAERSAQRHFNTAYDAPEGWFPAATA